MPDNEEKKFSSILLDETQFGRVLKTPNGKILSSNELVELFNELLNVSVNYESEIKSHNEIYKDYMSSVGVEL